MSSVLARPLIAAIRGYQRLPRLRPPVCRFDPTCSSYAVTALETHGIVRGSWLALRRVGRCHPWGPTGWDPVPGSSDDSDVPGGTRRKAQLIDG